MFLSEPKVFAPDINNLMQIFNDKFCFTLNSEDNHDIDLAMSRSQAFGGTMVMWKKSLDSFITVHQVSSPSFLPIILRLPNSPDSIHICLYLPTSGQETEFADAITDLRVVIEDLKKKYPEAIIYLRGDSNVNKNNTGRLKMFNDFVSYFKFKNIQTNHKTYHHFIGDGLFDSDIDIIIHSDEAQFDEKIVEILCQNDFPEVDSHHDVIVSSLTLPLESQAQSLEFLITAPKVTNSLHNITWSDDLSAYRAGVAPKLARLRQEWATPNSPVTVSVLLELTNQVLGNTALSTNKSTSSIVKHCPKTLKIPREIFSARLHQRRAHRAFKNAKKHVGDEDKINDARELFKSARRALRQATRSFTHIQNMKRDSKLYSILTTNPSALYRSIKAAKRPSSRSVPFISVADKKYVGERVCDGLYDSISSLKTMDLDSLSSSPKYETWSQDYEYILQICKDKGDIPPLSLTQSTDILKRMKPKVKDIWSVTPLHYYNAGEDGLVHFNFILNQIIRDINSSSTKQLNTVHAQLLHKGHGKSVTSDRSYRSISTCPVVSKALDIHIRDIFIENWNSVQAETQYQGEGRSHELASLLVTECIQHSLYNQKLPIFMLLLDARSAFDTVVTKFLIRNLFFTGMTGQSLLYMNNRLSNRLTYCSWEQDLMGPIFDQHGLEQGGCSASDCYKIYNNNLFETVQKSCQGVDFGNGLVISAVGQADDVALLSNDIFKLFNILHLALNYCKEYHVDLCADKTKLLHFSSSPDVSFVHYNPIQVNDQHISFSSQAEHVGVIRATSGNTPHLMNRFAAHKKALAAILFTGAARNHRGNLAAVMKIENLYALPVLLSGVASLVLSKAEENMLDQHYINTLRNLLKTYRDTPRTFVLFMCGSLPASAYLHLRQLSLFRMICNLPGDPLNKRAYQALSSTKPSSKSWFTRLRAICLQYNLPHPLILLKNPPQVEAFKKLAKSKVIDYWEDQLRSEAAILPSLQHFNPYFHSLTQPHPLLSTPGSNPHEISKAIIQCKMKSGKYRTASLCRHWTNNKAGFCLAPTCHESQETLEHLLIHCPHYNLTRQKIANIWTTSPINNITALLPSLLSGPASQLLHFILDPASHPQTIQLTTVYGNDIQYVLFHLTRSWCFAIHKARLRLLNKWKF